MKPKLSKTPITEIFDNLRYIPSIHLPSALDITAIKNVFLLV